MATFPRILDCPICAYLGAETDRRCCNKVESNGKVSAVGCHTAFDQNRNTVSIPGFNSNGKLSDFSVFFYFSENTSNTRQIVSPEDQIKADIARFFTPKRSTGLDPQPYSLSNEVKAFLHREIINQNGLNLTHTQWLQKRGLFADKDVIVAKKALEQLGFVSLAYDTSVVLEPFELTPLVACIPGFDKTGFYRVGGSANKPPIYGLGIPKRDFQGNVTLWQIKPDNAAKGSKYLFPRKSSEETELGGQTKKHNLLDGRMPITVHCFGKNPTKIGVLEGVLKPAIAAYKNPDWIMIGGETDIALTTSALQRELDNIFQAYPKIDRTIHVLPDAKSAWTSTGSLKKVINSIVKCGCNYSIGDWGQLFKSTTGDSRYGDPDEISPEVLASTQWISEIVAPENMKITVGKKVKSYQKGEVLIAPQKAMCVRHSNLDKIGQSERSKAAYKEPVFEPFEGEIKPNTGYKTYNQDETIYFIDTALKTPLLIANLSPPGTGKSWSAISYFLKQNKPMLFITSNPDSPSLKEVENQWKRATIRDAATCEYHLQINQIHKEVGMDGYKTYNFCQKVCPLFEQCKTSSGKGYGYLHLRNKDKSEPRLRLSAKSLFPDIKEKTVFVDELQQLQLTEQFKLPAIELLKVQQHLSSEGFCLSALFHAFKVLTESNSKVKKFGIDPIDFLKICSDTLPDDLTPLQDEVLAYGLKLQKQQDEIIKRRQADPSYRAPIPNGISWLLYLTEEIVRYRVKDKPQTTYTLDSKCKCITISRPNKIICDILSQTEHLIVNDATATEDDIQAVSSLLHGRFYTMVNQEVEESLTARNTVVNYSQIANWNHYLGIQRSNEVQERVTDALEDIAIEHPISETVVIDFKSWLHSYEERGYMTLNHFGEGRGSNKAENLTTLVIIGSTRQHRGSLKVDYLLKHLGSYAQYDDLDFEKFCYLQETKEIVQEVHRLRPNKQRNAELNIYFISKDTKDWIDPNINEVVLPSLSNVIDRGPSVLSESDMSEISEYITDYTVYLQTIFDTYKYGLSNTQSDISKTNEYITQFKELIKENFEIIRILSVSVGEVLVRAQLEKSQLEQAKRQIKASKPARKLQKVLVSISVLLGEVNTTWLW